MEAFYQMGDENGWVSECLGCEGIAYRPKLLRDGRTVCTECPDWRAETEARMVANMKSDTARAEHLQGVEKVRGKVAADQLRKAAWGIMRDD